MTEFPGNSHKEQSVRNSIYKNANIIYNISKNVNMR